MVEQQQETPYNKQALKSLFAVLIIQNLKWCYCINKIM